MRRLLPWCAVLLWPLLLTACAAAPSPPAETPVELAENQLSPLPALTELTETTLTTAATFDDAAYPLLAALPERDIWLYAAAGLADDCVLLRQGEDLQAFSWPWRNADFVLPRLALADDNFGGAGIFCVLQVSGPDQPLREELHYLYISENDADHWQEQILRPQEVLDEAYQRIHLQSESEEALRITTVWRAQELLHYTHYNLAWPEGCSPEDLAGLTLPAVSYGIGHADAPYYAQMALIELCLSVDGQNLPLGQLSYDISDGNPHSLPIESRLILGDLQYLRLAGDNSVAIPDSPHPQSGWAESIEENLPYGLTLHLPGNWQDNYLIQRAEDLDVPEDEAHWYEYFLCRVSERQCFEIMGGGMLFILDAYPLTGFEERFADAIEFGFAGNRRFLGQDGSYGYVLTQSSDVQVPDDALAALRYYTMRQENENIIERFITENGLQPFSFQN